jgi:hypothetical protein
MARIVTAYRPKHRRKKRKTKAAQFTAPIVTAKKPGSPPDGWLKIVAHGVRQDSAA